MRTGTEEALSIRVNGEERRIAEGSTVGDLLAQLGLHPGMVVVEQNREILRRDAVPSTPVRAGDQFELVHFVGGG